MVVLSSSADFCEALGAGLGCLEEGLTRIARESPEIKNLRCPGPQNGICVCGERSCVPPILMSQVGAAHVSDAVRAVWPDISEKPTAFTLAAQSVADLNARLRSAAGLSSELVLVDSGLLHPWPGFPDADNTWSTFSKYFEEGSGMEMEECWIVTKLAWGGHVPALGLTTGWLLASSRRMAEGLEAFAPDPSRAERVLRALDGARPGIWDAEDFRGLWPERC